MKKVLLVVLLCFGLSVGVSEGLSIHIPMYHIRDGVLCFENVEVAGADAESFERLGGGYGRDKNRCYFYGKPLLEADRDSFCILLSTDSGSGGYARDKNRIYLNGVVQERWDAATFGIIAAPAEGVWGLVHRVYTGDKNGVYLNGEPLPGADKSTFDTIMLMGSSFAKDAFHVYWQATLLEGADPTTFTRMGEGDYGKDKAGVYYREKRLEGANPRTFSIMKAPFSKDQKNLYYGAIKVEGFDLESFQMLDSSETFRDKNYLYYRGERRSEIDVSTYKEDIFGGYGKDRHHVFFYKKLILGADVATFKHLGDAYFVDQDRVYHAGVPIVGIDRKTVRQIGQFYIADEKHVWYSNRLLEDATPETIDLLDGGTIHARDAKSAYCFGMKIAGSDGPSFEIIWHYYSKDKNAVYYREKKLAGSDPKSFERLTGDYSKDKNQVYYQEKVLIGADPESFVSYGEAGRDKYRQYVQEKAVE